MEDNPIMRMLAAIALDEGDLKPLIARVKARKSLTEDEWKVVEQVLEAAAAGRDGWRPPNRPPHSDARLRRTAYGVLYHYHHARLAYSTGGGQPVIILSHRDAVKQVAARYRRGKSWVDQHLGIARHDPKIMGDATIKGQYAALQAAVSKEAWEAEQARRHV